MAAELNVNERGEPCSLAPEQRAPFGCWWATWWGAVTHLQRAGIKERCPFSWQRRCGSGCAGDGVIRRREQEGSRCFHQRQVRSGKRSPVLFCSDNCLDNSFVLIVLTSLPEAVMHGKSRSDDRKDVIMHFTERLLFVFLFVCFWLLAFVSYCLEYFAILNEIFCLFSSCPSQRTRFPPWRGCTVMPAPLVCLTACQKDPN